MAGTANVNIVNAPKLTEGIENLGRGLDSIGSNIESLNNSLDSIAMHIDSNKETLNTMLDSIDSHLVNVSNVVANSGSGWFMDCCLPNLIGAIVSGLVALGIFYYGLKTEKKEEKKKKLASYQNAHKAIEVYVKALGNAVDLLNKNIDDFIDRCKDNKAFQLDHLELSVLSLDCIKQISISDLSLIYVTNRKGKLETKAKWLYNVQNQLDFLSSIAGQMRDFYMQNQQFGIQLMDQWNVYKKNIDDYNVALVTADPKNPVCVQFRTYIDPFFKKGENPIEWQPQEWIDNVIKNMHFWLTMKTASSHETAYVPYENNLRTLIHIEKQRKALMEGVGKMYEDYKEHIKESYKALCSNIESLNNNEYVDLEDIV